MNEERNGLSDEVLIEIVHGIKDIRSERDFPVRMSDGLCRTLTERLAKNLIEDEFEDLRAFQEAHGRRCPPRSIQSCPSTTRKKRLRMRPTARKRGIPRSITAKTVEAISLRTATFTGFTTGRGSRGGRDDGSAPGQGRTDIAAPANDTIHTSQCLAFRGALALFFSPKFGRKAAG